MTDIDPQRLQRAVHEVGHYLVWRELPGARIRQVRLTRGGGHVDVDWPSGDTPALVQGYLVGMIAGREADKVWCARTTGVWHDPATCAQDMAAIRKAQRRHRPSRQWTDSELATEAQRRLLRVGWGEIERLARSLARTGRLS